MRSTILPLMIAAAIPVLAAEKIGSIRSEGAIRKLVADFSTARNASDSVVVSNLYAEDSEYIPFGQTRIRGRAAIETTWSRLSDWQSQAQRTVRSIRFIKSDVAIVQIAVHFTGRATLDFVDTFVVVNKSRRWQIVVHESVLPPEEHHTVAPSKVPVR